MDKKATVRDVAREAGVSVATVSYIMNNRSDQKISEATRTKVLQIANLLNYRPSRAAINLSTGKTDVIGVAYCLNPETPSRNQEILTFLHLLMERLTRMNYDILFLCITEDADSIRPTRSIDAVIAIDLTHDQFKALSEKYFVPVINVDMLINDNLFFQVYPDYPQMIKMAEKKLGQNATQDFYLLYDRFSNEKFQEFVINGLSPERLIAFSDINQDLKNSLSGKKLIVLGGFLALVILPYVNLKDIAVISSEQAKTFLPEKTTVILNDVEKKANLTINILLNALDHNFDLDHDCKVRL